MTNVAGQLLTVSQRFSKGWARAPPPGAELPRRQAPLRHRPCAAVPREQARMKIERAPPRAWARSSGRSPMSTPMAPIGSTARVRSGTRGEIHGVRGTIRIAAPRLRPCRRFTMSCRRELRNKPYAACMCRHVGGGLCRVRLRPSARAGGSARVELASVSRTVRGQRRLGGMCRLPRRHGRCSLAERRSSTRDRFRRSDLGMRVMRFSASLSAPDCILRL